MFYRLLTILSFLVLTACGGSKPYLIKDASTYGSAGSDATVTIIDKRPDEDRTFSYGSMMVFSSNYGIWTLGDNQFSPNLLELLKTEVHKSLANQSEQPERVAVTLERMIVQSNHQADLLQSVSTNGSLGPLGVLIAEGMHGKKFELDYDKTRPFVMGLIKASIKRTYSSKQITEETVLVSKIENFSHHMDVQGREVAATNVVKDLMANFSASLD
ncbi:MAG: hypothetical protein OQK12_16120 [Motiliproteus sp.]|nr:hypothetical protein [Motiliproteus sp.]MCW9052812.1 hypothetical protein [Motiliproteus sp.]